METHQMPRRAWLRWTTGGLLGVPIGVFLGVVPFLGLIVAAIALTWAVARQPRAAAVSGLLIGAGVTYLVLLLRALADCTTTAVPGYFHDCRPPDDLAVYQGAALAVVALGALLLVVEVVVALRNRNAVRED